MGILSEFQSILKQKVRFIKTMALTVLWLYLAIIEISVSKSGAIDDNTIKAIYSYKFGKFTAWPDSKLNDDTTNLGFCILGKNPFDSKALEAIDGKQIKGKTLHLDFFESGLLSDDALPNCHILFVSQSEKLRLQNIFESLRYLPILTVSDIKGFSSNGGMITLFNSNEQIHFEINLDAVNQAGLSISSKLVELAKKTDYEGKP